MSDVSLILNHPCLNKIVRALDQVMLDDEHDENQHSRIKCGRRQPQQHSHSHEHKSSNPADDHDDLPDNEFHLSIPSLLTHGRSLASMDQTALAEVLQPVLSSLKNLDAESLLCLERVENGARLCDGVNVRPIHDEVYPKYDNFGNMSCVRYIHITEVPEQYSIGVFVFPPFSRIPLHDHPEMCVLSRLLYGDLQCLSLDLPTAQEDQQQHLNMMMQHQQQQLQMLQQQQQRQQQQRQYHPYQALHHQQQQQQQLQLTQQQAAGIPYGLPDDARRAFKNPVKHLHAPDVSMLFPYRGNLHEFFAGPHGAAVLDILLPPYDVDHERDCTFYDIREDTIGPSSQPSSSGDNTSSSGMDVDTTEDTDGDNDRTPCWIVPTGQPHDFHCLSGQYHKLGANVIHMQDSA